jgi:hypothetical protein
MKYCYKCKIIKNIEDFNKNKSTKDGLQKECKKCNKQKIINCNLKNRKKQAHRNRLYIIEYLQTHPCVDCHETDLLVLQFDHVEDKKINVSRAAHLGFSKKKLFEEIKKCEVRCANCHMRKTAKEQNWFKLLNQANKQPEN